jgi:hypothetical protein
MFFTSITINDREVLVGKVFKRTSPNFGRDGTQEVKYGFAIRRGGILENCMFADEGDAILARNTLLGAEPEQDTDARDRVVMDLLSNHTSAECDPQADGSVMITARDPSARYHVHADGTILEAGLVA